MLHPKVTQPFLVLSPTIFPLKEKSASLLHSTGERPQGVIQRPLNIKNSYPWNKPKIETVLSLVLPGEFQFTCMVLVQLLIVPLFSLKHEPGQ